MDNKRPGPDSADAPEPKPVDESSHPSDREGTPTHETQARDDNPTAPTPTQLRKLLHEVVTRARQLANTRTVHVAGKVAGALVLVAAGAAGAAVFKGRPAA